jgi:hypothetical protein
MPFWGHQKLGVVAVLPDLLRATGSLAVIFILVVASSSVLATGGYLSGRPQVTDDEALLFEWAYKNVPASTTVIVSDSYNLYQGLETLDGKPKDKVIRIDRAWTYDQTLAQLQHACPVVVIIDSRLGKTFVEVILDRAGARVTWSNGSLRVYTLTSLPSLSPVPDAAMIVGNVTPCLCPCLVSSDWNI